MKYNLKEWKRKYYTTHLTYILRYSDLLSVDQTENEVYLASYILYAKKKSKMYTSLQGNIFEPRLPNEKKHGNTEQIYSTCTVQLEAYTHMYTQIL